MESKYRNIACGTYDELELLAVHAREVKVNYVKDDQETEELMIIKDVYAREGSEYLLNAKGEEIRLDQLRVVDGKEVIYAC